MLPVPVDSSLRYRCGRDSGNHATYIAWIGHGQLVPFDPAAWSCGGRLQRGPPAPAAWCSRVDICRPAPSVLVDDVASRHRQSTDSSFRSEGEPASLGDPQVPIGQELELKPGARRRTRRPYCGSWGESATIEAPNFRAVRWIVSGCSSASMRKRAEASRAASGLIPRSIHSVRLGDAGEASPAALRSFVA